MNEIRTLADVDLGRMHELTDALVRGDAMPLADREEIVRLMFGLYRAAFPVQVGGLPGRPRTETFYLACAARTLVERYGTTVKAALSAVAPNATADERESIARTYRTKEYRFDTLADDHPLVVEAKRHL